MRLQSFPTRVLLSWLLAACLSPAAPAALAATVAAPVPAPATALVTALDNVTCQTCHDGSKGKLEVPAPDDTKRALRSVANDAFTRSPAAAIFPPAAPGSKRSFSGSNRKP